MAGSEARPPEGLDSLHEGSRPKRQEAAEYIATMLEALRIAAQQVQLPFLAYLISVALEEAKNEKSKRG